MHLVRRPARARHDKDVYLRVSERGKNKEKKISC